MIKFVVGLWRGLRNAVYDTIITHDGIEHAGYLAFLSLLAMFPFMVFMVAILGVIGEGEIGAHFIASLFQSLPQNIVASITPRIEEITSGPPQGLLTISILGAIWTASSLIEGTRTVLNRAYRVGNPPSYWFRRSLSIVQLILFAFILLAGMFATVFMPWVLGYFEHLLGTTLISGDLLNWQYSAYLLTIGLLFVGVCYIYYIIPNIKQKLVTVAPGAFLTILLWLGAAKLFTMYLSNFNQVNLIYGSLGGIIATLIFFYICNIIFIIGAEINHQVAEALDIRAEQREATTTA